MIYFLQERLHLEHVPPKQRMFGGIFLSFSLVVWGLVYWILVSHAEAPLAIAFIMVGGLVWTLAYLIVLLFIQQRFAYLLYGCLTLLLLLFFGFHGSSVLGIILFGFLLILAHERSQRTRAFLAEFNAPFIARKGLAVFFTGLALLIAFLYTSFTFSPTIEDLIISPKAYHVAFYPAETVFKILFPGYRSGMTMDEFQQFVLSNITKRFFPKEKIESRPLALFDKGVGSETLEEYTRTLINKNLQNILAPYQDLLPTFFIIGIFFAVRFLLWPFMWLVIGTLVIAIKLLLLYNILTIKKVEVVKDVPVLGN